MTKFTTPEALHKRGVSKEDLKAYAQAINNFLSQKKKPMHSDFKSVLMEALKEPENGNGGDPEKKGKKKKEKKEK